jgi:transcriptional regulator with XRE-family HTH domain
MGKRVQTHGDLLRAARQAQGLSVEKLAGDLGVSLSYLAMVERGEKKPTLWFLCRVARHLRFPRVATLNLLKVFLGSSKKISIDVPQSKTRQEALATVLLDLY